MTGYKMLQLVMPDNYRQGFTYPTKKKYLYNEQKKVNHIAKSLKKIRKNGQTMLRRTLKRDMLNQLDEDNG